MEIKEQPVYIYECCAQKELNLVPGDLLVVLLIHRFCTPNYYQDIYARQLDNSFLAKPDDTVMFLETKEEFMDKVGDVLVSKWLVNDRTLYSIFEGKESLRVLRKPQLF